MKGRTIGILAGLGAIVLGTALTTWLSGTVTTLTSQQPLVVSGTAAAPAVVASGAILLVSALALTTASRTVARVILAVAAATSALGVGMVVWVLAHTEDVMIASASGTSALEGTIHVSPILYLNLATQGVAVVFSLFALWRVKAWSFERTRFESASTAPADPRTQAMDDWDALSAGDDPSGETGSLGTNRRSS